MKLITANVVALIVDAKVRQTVVELFNAIPQKDSSGGMTLDMGNNQPMVVCHGKPSLADEKSLRQQLRVKLGNDKIKLSRTNNVDTRVSQYDIAKDPAMFKDLFGKAKPTEKPTEKKQDETPVQGPVEKNGTPPAPVEVK